MANFRRFLYEDLHSGENIGIYLNRWPMIGNGRVEIIKDLHLKVCATMNVFGRRFEGTVEAIMPNESPSGICKLSINNRKKENCEYITEGRTLIINHSEAQIRIQNHDKEWSWIHIQHGLINSWFGIWPKESELKIEDTVW